MTRRPRFTHAALSSAREPIGRAIRTLMRGPAAAAPTASPTAGNGSLPMRTTMSFLTSTSTVASELPTEPPAHTLEVVGYDRDSGHVVLRERIGRDSAMALLTTTGAGAGTTIPLARGTRATHRPLMSLTAADVRGWELTTRVIQRRGLRVFGDMAPIRKFAIGLTVQQRLGGVMVAQGRVVATAYLRPRAALASVWLIPGEAMAVAIVSYCGVPTGVGVDKQIAVLAAPTWQ